MNKVVSISSKPRIEHVIYLPDIHVPVEDKETMAAVEAYMADHHWDEIIYGGDFLNMDSISSHNENNLRAIAATSIYDEAKAGNVMLNRHERITPTCKRRTFLTGNHENRIERYINANPQLRGLIEVDKLLKLEKRGYKYVPFWEKGKTHRVGKAVFIHGEYTNAHHAAATVGAYGTNVFYGHTHDIQSHSKTTKGNNKTKIGQSLGCLLAYSQEYMRGTPSKWQQGFGVFWFLPDGFFNYMPVHIFNHRFVSPEGRLYDGKELYRETRRVA